MPETKSAVEPNNVAEMPQPEESQNHGSVELPMETLNKVLNVLATLPYSQVADVMAEVQKTAKVSGE